MKNDLEHRLVDFASNVISLSQNLVPGQPSKVLGDQILRSGTSCALNYGEAQNAQSKRDFISKCSIVLKELRETSVNLKIIQQTRLYKSENQIVELFKENLELVAIFTAILKTANKNLRKY
jgi:four helix bundle protein